VGGHAKWELEPEFVMQDSLGRAASQPREEEQEALGKKAGASHGTDYNCDGWDLDMRPKAERKGAKPSNEGRPPSKTKRCFACPSDAHGDLQGAALATRPAEPSRPDSTPSRPSSDTPAKRRAATETKVDAHSFLGRQTKAREDACGQPPQPKPGSTKPSAPESLGRQASKRRERQASKCRKRRKHQALKRLQDRRRGLSLDNLKSLDGHMVTCGRHVTVPLVLWGEHTQAIGRQEHSRERGVMHSVTPPHIAVNIDIGGLKRRREETRVIGQERMRHELPLADGLSAWEAVSVDWVVSGDTSTGGEDDSESARHQCPAREHVMECQRVATGAGILTWALQPADEEGADCRLGTQLPLEDKIMDGMDVNGDTLLNDLRESIPEGCMEVARSSGALGQCDPTDDDSKAPRLQRGKLPRAQEAVLTVVAGRRGRCLLHTPVCTHVTGWLTWPPPCGPARCGPCPVHTSQHRGMCVVCWCDTPRLGGHLMSREGRLEGHETLRRLPWCQVKMAVLCLQCSSRSQGGSRLSQRLHTARCVNGVVPCPTPVSMPRESRRESIWTESTPPARPLWALCVSLLCVPCTPQWHSLSLVTGTCPLRVARMSQRTSARRSARAAAGGVGRGHQGEEAVALGLSSQACLTGRQLHKAGNKPTERWAATLVAESLLGE